MDELANYLRAALAHFVGNVGFQPPLTLTAVAVNGSLCAIRTDGEHAEAIAEYSPDGNLVVPINIMVTDSRGEAARVLIDTSGEMSMH